MYGYLRASSLIQGTSYCTAIYSFWGKQAIFAASGFQPCRHADNQRYDLQIPNVSFLQAWSDNEGEDVLGSPFV